MQTAQAFITRIMSDDHALSFLCDRSFTITAVGKRAAGPPLKLSPGLRLQEVFPGSDSVLALAGEKLDKGALYVSTRFEVFPVLTTIFMLQFREEQEHLPILCLAELGEDTLPAPWEALSLITDRYRTPVFNLLNSLDALEIPLQQAEEYQALQRLDSSLGECYHILCTIQNVRDYAGLLCRETVPRFVWLELGSWLEQAVQSVQTALRFSRQVRFTGAGEPVLTMFDEKLLALAMFQLLSNACAFSPEGSPVTVRLRRRENTAQITVTDEGDGIPQEDLSKVFDPLYTRYDAPVSEERMGTGLGLPIAQKIAELHGGRVMITSKRHQGTTVALTLPIREPDLQDKLPLRSDSARYLTDRYSPLQILFHHLKK